MVFRQYITDFVSLFFPETCLGCKRSLNHQESFICTHCHYDLPYTQYHFDKDNKAARLLGGRVPFENVSSCFYFSSGSVVQQILHSIKYRNKSKAARYFGQHYGRQLLSTENFNEVELIIPVPLHRKKLAQRGYNQSECFAEGLAESMNIKMQSNILKRISHTASQTTKTNRYERYENIKESFKVERLDLLKNRHVLLVDDVLTTGATLEACASALLKAEGLKISVVTLAHATY